MHCITLYKNIHLLISFNVSVKCTNFDNFWQIKFPRNLQQVIKNKPTALVNSSTSAQGTAVQKCYRSTLWNAQLLHLVEVILFVEKMAEKSRLEVGNLVCANTYIRKAYYLACVASLWYIFLPLGCTTPGPIQKFFSMSLPILGTNSQFQHIINYTDTLQQNFKTIPPGMFDLWPMKFCIEIKRKTN